MIVSGLVDHHVRLWPGTGYHQRWAQTPGDWTHWHCHYSKSLSYQYHRTIERMCWRSLRQSDSGSSLSSDHHRTDTETTLENIWTNVDCVWVNLNLNAENTKLQQVSQQGTVTIYLTGILCNLLSVLSTKFQARQIITNEHIIEVCRLMDLQQHYTQVAKYAQTTIYVVFNACWT